MRKIVIKFQNQLKARIPSLFFILYLQFRLQYSIIKLKNNECKIIVKGGRDMAIRNVLTQSLFDNVSVEKLYMNKEKYNTKILLQRGFVWERKRSSLLIQSLLLGYPIPTLIFNLVDGEYMCLDGVNRFTSVISYLDDEYELTENIDNIVLTDLKGKDVEYEIKNKKFSELPLEVQNHLRTRILKLEIMQDLDEDTQSEVLLRLNEGLSMSTIAKARVKSYKEIHPFVQGCLSLELFTRKVNITTSSKSKFTHEALIYTIIALECSLDVSATNYVKIADEVNENNLLTDDIKETILSVFEKMDSVFPAKSKILSSTNIVPLYFFFKDLDIKDERETLAKLETLFKDKDFLKEYKQDATRATKEIIMRRSDMIKRQYESV